MRRMSFMFDCRICYISTVSIDRRKITIEIEKIYSVLELFQTRNISETDKIVWAAAMIGYKRMESTEIKEPY